MKRFEEYCQSEIRSLISHLKDYDRQGKAEALHQVRVDIKRIKSIHSVINGCVKGFKAHRSFMPFRNIFRKAGRIRDRDVLGRLLEQYNVDERADDLMPGNAKRKVAAFRSGIPRMIDGVRKCAPGLIVFSKKVHHNDFRSYVVNKKKEVRSQLYPRPNMAIIHKVRKGIKEILYLSELGNGSTKRESKFYENMQDVIGGFHDKQVLLELLMKKSVSANSAQLRLIRSDCLADKKEIFRLAANFYKK
ncbi:MAG TPA: CHAD domain-containing protein [Chryseolinea sp.]